MYLLKGTLDGSELTYPLWTFDEDHRIIKVNNEKDFCKYQYNIIRYGFYGSKRDAQNESIAQMQKYIDIKEKFVSELKQQLWSKQIEYCNDSKPD